MKIRGSVVSLAVVCPHPSGEIARDLTEWSNRYILCVGHDFPNMDIDFVLGCQVFEVKVTSRLKDSPAIISSHESGALRKMMRMVEQQNSGEAAAMPKQKIEINPK